MIKVKTKYDEETVTKFYQFSFYHNKQKKTMTLLAIFCIFCGLLNFFTVEDKNVAVLIFMVGISILLHNNTTIFLNRQIKELIKSDIRLKMGLENEFIFYDNYFEVKNQKSWSKLFYSELYCYCEDEENFYLYLNLRNAFIVKKEEHKLEVSTLLEKNVKKSNVI